MVTSPIDTTADFGLAAPSSAAERVSSPEGGASYTRVAIALHWIIAFFILGQIGLGWSLGTLPMGPARGAMVQLHKSIGITILLLSLARLAWRVARPAPPQLPMPHWQREAAALVHWSFYGLMIGLPLTGWIMVSASTVARPTILYGLVPWPAVPFIGELEPASKAAWHALGENGHAFLALSAIALILLHLGAVAKHQLLDRDRVFARMAPGAQPGWKEKWLWLALTCALLAALVGRSYASLSRAGDRASLSAPAGQLPPSTAEAKHGAR
jgi:cytochrome b561